LSLQLNPAIATEEQYSLFSRYQRNRHGGGDMAAMDFFDYQALIEDTPIETSVLEARDYDGHLIAACLTDMMATGLSAVYSFFDPKLSKLGMGNFMISECLIFGKKNKYKHLYLGYYISEISSMSYKSRFKPGQILDGSDWQSL